MRYYELSTLNEELEIVSTAIKGKTTINKEGRRELSRNLLSFWQPKLNNLVKGLEKAEGINALYYGGETYSYPGKRRHFLFLSRAGLYCDKVLFRDPFLEALRIPDPTERHEALFGAWAVFNSFKEDNLSWVSLVPAMGAWDGGILDEILEVSAQDSENRIVRESILRKQPENDFWGRHRDYIVAREAKRRNLPIDAVQTGLVKDMAFDVNSVLLESKVLGAIPMTDHQGYSQALSTIAEQRLSPSGSRKVDRAVLEGIFNLDLPIITSEIPLQKLNELRRTERESFWEFRQALRQCFNDLEDIGDQTELRRRADQVNREIILPAMMRLDKSYHRLRVKAIASGASLAVSSTSTLVSALCGNIAGFISSFIPSLISCANLGVDMAHLNSIKTNQFYFLWKLQM